MNYASPQEIKSFFKLRGFIDKYYEFVVEGYTFRKSYELTEERHHEIFGANRYSNYESFKVILSKFIKKDLGK